MNKLFEKIGELIEKRPVKTLLFSVLLFIILFTGVSRIKMATGNETLVKDDNPVYQSNKEMEESFGGEAILVLFTDSTQGNLLSYENINKIWDVEQRLQYEENIFSIMSPASIVHQMTERQSFEIKKQILTISDGLVDVSEQLQELSNLVGGNTQLEMKLNEIAKGLEIFHNKSNMMVATIPGNQIELDQIIYDDQKAIRTIFKDVILDDQNCLMVVKLQGNLGDEEKKRIGKELISILQKEEFDNLSYIVSGKPILDASLQTEMKSNMMMMVVLAVMIMFIILAIVFKVRWRMLSLGVILLSVIATLGFMGILSVPITMVSMAVFPILIGLGIDYSIQFHNRYEEEKSVKNTMRQMGKALAIAVFATVLGFISLYASPVPMIQDFGKMLTIGAGISFMGSIFLLMPILYLREKSKDIDKGIIKEITQEITKIKIEKVVENKTWLERMLKVFTKAVIKLSIPILIVVISLAALGFFVDKKVGVETDIETFMPQKMDALKDIKVIRTKVGSTDQIALYLKDTSILTKENIRWIQEKTKEIEENYKDVVVSVKSIDTLVGNLSVGQDLSQEDYIKQVDILPKQQVNMFLNEKQTEAVILLNIKHIPTKELQALTEKLAKNTMDTNMKVQITGKSVLDIEMVNGLTSGRVIMTLIGLILVFAALFLIYRNVVKAIIPILPVALIIGMSSGIMYLLGIQFTPITATLGALVLGMGTEMTVMLLERYLEERKLGKEKMESMIITVTMIGKAIIASGLTTVGGFSVLMTSRFTILRDFGFMTVINISLVLISTFVVLPPIIILLDPFMKGKKAN